MARADTISYVALAVAVLALGIVLYMQHKVKKMCKRQYDFGGMLAKASEAWNRIPPEDKERMANRVKRFARRGADQIQGENPKAAWLLREATGDADTVPPSHANAQDWNQDWKGAW